MLYNVQNCFFHITFLLVLTLVRSQSIYEPFSDLWQTLSGDQYYGMRPWQNGETVNASVSLTIFGLSNFKMQRQCFDIDTLITVWWLDERLKRNRCGSKFLLNTAAQRNSLWKPDLIFPNALESKLVDDQYWTMEIDGNGFIKMQIRLVLTVFCEMDLMRYPMDKQICGPSIRSFNLPKTYLVLKWSEKDPIILKDASLSLKKYVSNIESNYCSFNDSVGVDPNDHISDALSGEFSCLVVHIELSRENYYLVFSLYIATSVLVMCSWVSFYIDPLDVQGRATLVMLGYFSLITASLAYQGERPEIEITTLLDVWLRLCLFFIFGVVVQFAIVTHYGQRANLAREEQRYIKISCANIDLNSLHHRTMITWFVKKNEFFKNLKRALFIDRVSAVIFPVTFLFASTMYWITIMDH